MYYVVVCRVHACALPVGAVHHVHGRRGGPGGPVMESIKSIKGHSHVAKLPSALGRVASEKVIFIAGSCQPGAQRGPDACSVVSNLQRCCASRSRDWVSRSLWSKGGEEVKFWRRIVAHLTSW